MNGEIVGPADALSVPRFAGLRSFARLPRAEDVDRPGIAILGVPFDSAVTFRPGARFGPAAIREASLLIRGVNEALDVAPFASIQVVDAGDVGATPMDIAHAHEAIEATALVLQSQGTQIVALGGDHSVSLPLLRAAAAVHGPLALLQFDSHMDTSDAHFGARYTHGTAFRRAIEEKLIEPTSSVQVGLRGSLYRKADIAENHSLGFTTVLAREFDALGVKGTLDVISRTVGAPVYVTVDIDVLDPAFAPGTGTPECGGLTSRELLALLRGLRDIGVRPVSGDVVEVAPAYDPAGVTALAAATVAFELVSLLAGQNASPATGA